jgi:hypothetical protein
LQYTNTLTVNPLNFHTRIAARFMFSPDTMEMTRSFYIRMARYFPEGCS